MIIREKLFDENRTHIMGIMNVTPDSFSDGDKTLTDDFIVEKCKRLELEGAGVIDVGAESTRPGACEVSVEEEIKRLAVLPKIISSVSCPVSVDTYKAETAYYSLKCGAHIINDVKGLEDKGMAEAVAEFGAHCVIMHSAERRKDMDLVEDIMDYLDSRVKHALKCGISAEKIILDPGVGFNKTTDENLDIIKRLAEFKKSGYPVLLGCSRKSVIGNTLNIPVGERLSGTIATSVCGVFAGAMFLRVHDVRENLEAVKMTEAVLYGQN